MLIDVIVEVITHDTQDYLSISINNDFALYVIIPVFWVKIDWLYDKFIMLSLVYDEF